MSYEDKRGHLNTILDEAGLISEDSTTDVVMVLDGIKDEADMDLHLNLYYNVDRPTSGSPVSLAVTPSARKFEIGLPRSIPRFPFEKIELPRMLLPVPLLLETTSTPSSVL